MSNSFYSNSATLGRDGTPLAYLQAMGTRLTTLRASALSDFESLLRTTESVVLVRLERQLAVEGLKRVYVIDGGDVCAVCLEEMEEGHEAKAMGCYHTYHSNCISDWLRLKPTCPLCRYDTFIDSGRFKRRRIGD